ncbi:MAG: hypothetical protein Kow0063_17470 [Anaerolineae bacterium]
MYLQRRLGSFNTDHDTSLRELHKVRSQGYAVWDVVANSDSQFRINYLT